MHTSKLKKLLSNLSAPDASKRRSAAESLAEGDERAVYPLIKALRDDNLGVQDAAMRSLMEIKGESTAYMVLPLLRENAFLRNTAMVILREIGEEAVPLFEILLQDKDDDVRKFALDLIHDIRYCGYPEKIVGLLKNDPNANVRAAAARTLGVLRYKQALPDLINALKDDEWVCFSSLEALTNLKHADAVKQIASLLESNSEAIRFAAIETLGKIGTGSSRKILSSHLSRADGFERNATIASLVRTGSVPSKPGIADILTDILENDEWEDKLIAARGLVLLKEKKAVRHIIDLAGSLDSSNPDSDDKLNTLIKAAEHLGCTEHLADVLRDESFRFRGKIIAIEIAGKLKCKKAFTPLLQLLESDIREIRMAAVTAISRINPEHAGEYVLNALNDNDGHVRKSAAAALGHIGEMSAFERLLHMLRNEEYSDVSDEAIIALLNINRPLFMSRINEFDEHMREIIEMHASAADTGPAC